jgi:hypothetical protein
MVSIAGERPVVKRLYAPDGFSGCHPFVHEYNDQTRSRKDLHVTETQQECISQQIHLWSNMLDEALVKQEGHALTKTMLTGQVQRLPPTRSAHRGPS